MRPATIFASRLGALHFADRPAYFAAQLLLSLHFAHLVGQFSFFELFDTNFGLLLRSLLLCLVIGLDHFHHVGDTLLVRRLNDSHTIAVDRLLRIDRSQFWFVLVRQSVLQLLGYMQRIKLFRWSNNWL